MQVHVILPVTHECQSYIALIQSAKKKVWKWIAAVVCQQLFKQHLNKQKKENKKKNSRKS